MPVPVKTKEKVSPHTINLNFFARFLLENHLKEFAEKSIAISRQRKVPLLKYLDGMPVSALKVLAEKGASELLTSLANDNATEYLTNSVQRWLTDQLPMIEKDQVVVEDITLVARVRKEVFVHFIPKYTQNVTAIANLINDIDDFILEYSSITFKAFTRLMERRISEHMALTQRANESLRQAQAITHIGSYEWDLTTTRLTWSDELFKIYELSPDTDLPDSSLIKKFNHPDDDVVVSRHIEHSIRTLEPFDFHYRIILPDARQKCLHARGEIKADETGKALKIIGTAQDVTSQKQLERKLIENEIFIKKIADAAPALIASYNIKTGKYVFVNDSIKKILGYDPQVVFEKGLAFFASIVHPEDLPRIMEENNSALETSNAHVPENGEETISEFQYRMKHSNGEYRWFHTFGTVFDRDASNAVEHVLNISLDITERIKAEQVLLERTAELQQSNASLEEFAFVASHDLKEPLRKIITFSDRLITSQKNHLSHEGQNVLEKIMNSAVRMQQMVSDLLSLSVISAEKTFVKTDLSKILADVLMAFEHKIEELKADITTDDLPEVEVVPSQFRQLFQNLIGNSLKFSRKEVTPRISINHTYISANDVRGYSNIKAADRYLKIDISDNGIGFDNAYLDKIFAVFQRLHQREHFEGTGIGLAICKKIVENHGGVITASGIPQKGAVFSVIIPQ